MRLSLTKEERDRDREVRLARIGSQANNSNIRAKQSPVAPVSIKTVLGNLTQVSSVSILIKNKFPEFCAQGSSP